MYFDTDSDFELEELVPDASVANLDLLSIEAEIKPFYDDKQSLGKLVFFIII